MRRGFLLSSILSVMILSTSMSWAKDAPDVNLDFFRPSVHSGDILGVQGGWIPDHLVWTVGGYLKYAYKPLAVLDPKTGDPLYQSLTHQAGMDLYGSVSLWSWVSVGLDIPVYFVSSGEAPPSTAVAAFSKVSGASLGDMRLGLKFKLFSQGKQGFSLALSEDLTFPTSTSHNFTGDKGVTSSTYLVMDYNYRGYIFAFNLGYRARKNVQLGSISANDQLLIAAGARLPLMCRKLDLIGTAKLRTPISSPFSSKYSTGFDLLGGVDVHLPMNLGLMVAAGGGTTRAYGSPKFRVVAGLAYRPGTDRSVCDMDGDGIDDDVDACPKTPGKAALKGCPDKDNDMIADKDDQCPDKPGLAKFHGCPDTDKDGIEDRFDRCPKTPGIARFKGCPDKDNDGIEDAKDKCPNQPGPAKYDGCPDTDGDGIIDMNDKCPEVRGTRKYNGCPPPKVRVTKKKIEILEKVHFKTGSAKIMKDSYDLLRQVAETLKENPQILKVRIEGHTDNRGSLRFNMRLSKRRAKAVMDFLIKEGVAPERLEYAGYGPTRPIASNKTREGRAKNRRVEFVILKVETQQVNTPSAQ